MDNIIFIHGLESSGKGFKGRFFRKLFPECLTPNFEKYDEKGSVHDLLKKRMAQLSKLLEKKEPWVIIGSSFGGLMASVYTCKFPTKVARLILLAPFLVTPELVPEKYSPVDVPVIIFHGKNDKVVPPKPSHVRAEKLFTNLTYKIVDDDHLLHKTVKTVNWKELILAY